MKAWLKFAIAIAQLLIIAGAFYAGDVWCDRNHAKTELADTHTALDATRADLSDYHKALQGAAAQFQQDTEQLRGIAEDYANGRTKQQQFYGTLDAKLDAFFAHRPDLAACDIGPDGLRLWNDANRGGDSERGDGGSGTATGQAGPQPGGGVPAAAAGDRQPPARAAEESHGGGGAVRGLPQSAQRAGEGGQGARRAGDSAAAARTGRNARPGEAAGSSLVADLAIAMLDDYDGI